MSANYLHGVETLEIKNSSGQSRNTAAVLIIIENAASDALDRIEKAKFCKGAVRQSRPARLCLKAAGMKKLRSNFEMECKALAGNFKTAKIKALSAIETAETNAVNNINTAGTSVLDEINTAQNQAVLEIQCAVSSALNQIQEILGNILGEN